MIGEEILRVFEQFLLREGADESDNGVRADKGKGDTAKALNQRVRAFQEQAELEKLMNAVLVQGACS